MVWTLDMDDFLGTFCNQGKYPLINVLKKGLNLEQACKIFNTFIIGLGRKSTYCYQKKSFIK